MNLQTAVNFPMVNVHQFCYEHGNQTGEYHYASRKIYEHFPIPKINSRIQRDAQTLNKASAPQADRFLSQGIPCQPSGSERSRLHCPKNNVGHRNLQHNFALRAFPVTSPRTDMSPPNVLWRRRCRGNFLFSGEGM